MASIPEQGTAGKASAADAFVELNKEAKEEIDSLQQRRMQRKQLKRYADSEEDEDSDSQKNGDDKGIKESVVRVVKTEDEDSNHQQSNGIANSIQEIACNEEHVQVESKVMNTNVAKPTTFSSTTTVNTTETTASSKRPINPIEALSQFANQNLNGELSLLQNYENNGVMNEVFGSQSLLSQELMQSNNFSQQSLPWQQQKEDIKNSSSQGTDIAMNNPSSFNNSIALDENKLVSDVNVNEIQASQVPSTISSSKLGAHEDSLSFHVNSLPPLSLPETQVSNDTETEPSNISLSQISTVSGYDVMVGSLPQSAVLSGSSENLNEDGAMPPLPNLPIKEGFKGLQDPLSNQELPETSTNNNEPSVDNTTMNQVFDSDGSISRKREASDVQGNSESCEKPDKIPRQDNIAPQVAPMTPMALAPYAAAMSGYIQTNGTMYSYKKSRAERQRIEEETNYTARRAAELVQQLRVNKKVEKQLLLSMALTRENPRTAPASYPAKGSVIENGFFWGQFPPLEKVLRSHMEEYYELSIEKCQSRTQQAFNNDLVSRIQEEAKNYGWKFDSNAFDEKKIRDRIRCFFKTHIQNAKKRLKTMVRNPLKRANAKALAAHLDLIEKCDLVDKINEQKDIAIPVGDGNTSTDTKPAVPFEEHNSRNIWDSDAHDAAQVVSSLYYV